MKSFRWRIILLGILLLIVFPTLAQDSEPTLEATESDTEAVESDTESTEAVEPLVIYVGVYVVGASEFNLDTGTYNVDFYLSMTCSRECTDDEMGYDIVGINGTESLQTEDRTREPDYAEYRIQAVLNQNDIDLTRYPFDSHQLNVIIESKFFLMDEVEYVVDEEYSGVDSDVKLQGWNLSQDYSATVVEKVYTEGETGYSRLIFTMSTDRVAIAAFIRSILPALVILLISFVGTFMPDRNQRIGLTGGILLAMLLHHLAVGAGIPPVGYPVYFDAFMLLNDAAILLSFAGTVYELVREKKGVDDTTLDWFSYKTLAVLVVIWILGQIIVLQAFMNMS